MATSRPLTCKPLTSREKSLLAVAERRRKRQEDTRKKQQLIAEIHCRAAIWDRRLPEHRDNIVVNELWAQVAAATGLSKLQCKKNWKHLVDHFRTLFYAARAKYQTSGTALVEILESQNSLKWAFFKHLLFLHDIVAKRKMDGDLCVGESEVEEDKALDQIAEDRESVLAEVREHLQVPVTLSPEISLGSPSACSTSSTLLTEPMNGFESGRKHTVKSEESMEEAFWSKVGVMYKEVSQNDSAAKFADYLAVILRQVPAVSRRQCELELLNIVNQYADGNINVASPLSGHFVRHSDTYP